MPTPLLRTKLHIPPVRPELVPRPRLIERLNAGLHRKLTLVSAPAGFGKTTLLSEWIAGCGRSQPSVRIAWLSLDKGDNDPARFWAYSIAALHTIHEDVGEAALAALPSPQSPPIESILTTLINEITAIPDGLVLVFDDYHVIEAQPIHDALAFLLDHLPPQMHLIIATRADPPLPLSRLRGRGHLTELRTADLRFTPEEAAAFLNQAMGLGLSAEDVAVLEARTEGWIVGLQMVALSLQGGKDTASFIQAFTGSHRYILDYLTDEVLVQQQESVRTFLLQTAILDRLTAPLCDAVRFGIGETPNRSEGAASSEGTAVTKQEDSQTMLERLEAANLFIVPLDDERRWYRYHHLFADLLRRRLSRMQPDLLPALRRRASEWYEKNGLIAEAVSYALAAGDAELVARLVGGNVLAMMEHGELTTLERWLGALPDQVVRSQPWLCVAHAWMLAFTGQLDAVTPLLQDAERAVAARDEAAKAEPEGQRMAGHIAAIRAYLAGVRGNAPEAVDFAHEALQRLPADDLMIRGWATVALALNLYRTGDVAAADQALADAVAISQATGDSYVAVMVLCNLAAVQAQQGRLRKAADTFRDALQLAEKYAGRAGRRLPVVGYAYTYLAQVVCEWNDLDAATSYVREGIELCRQWGEPQLLTGGYMSLATVLQAIGDANGALDAIREARQAASSLSPWYVARVAPLEALIRLKQGDVAAASRWAASQENGLDGYYDVFEYWSACLTLARVSIAQGHLHEAMGALTRLLNRAEAAGGRHYVIASLALQAIALQAQGELDQALIALDHALSLAEPEGYVRIFIDEGAPMGELLRKAAARGIKVDYVGRLLAALEEEGKDEGRVTEPPLGLLIEPLRERELEVLRLLAAGLSNREIAAELFLAVGTVKKYTSNIYGKLNVHRRAQAVARARELGLL
jgi:LuxR family maltose regulon positive regulatory protein